MPKIKVKNGGSIINTNLVNTLFKKVLSLLLELFYSIDAYTTKEMIISILIITSASIALLFKQNYELAIFKLFSVGLVSIRAICKMFSRGVLVVVNHYLFIWTNRSLVAKPICF